LAVRGRRWGGGWGVVEERRVYSGGGGGIPVRVRVMRMNDAQVGGIIKVPPARSYNAAS